MEARYKAARQAALAGGNVLNKYLGGLLDIEAKTTAVDLVTEADRMSEKAILDILKQQFQDDSFLAEESGLHSSQSEFLWVIDPLDGTTNFAHGYPFIAISIALIHAGKTIFGIVFNPIANEFFHAIENKGAFLNDHQIFVSQVKSLEKCLLASGFPYDRQSNPDNNYIEFCHFTHLTQGVRRGGAAALDLAYVACSRLDGYWEKGIKAWDIAAGVLLVSEAGGSASAYDGQPIDLNGGQILASNGLLHSRLSKELLTIRTNALQFSNRSMN
jgi:myo-inositol-1(or 4)-monophosphatase